MFKNLNIFLIFSILILIYSLFINYFSLITHYTLFGSFDYPNETTETQFDIELRTIVRNSPISEKTKRNKIILFVTNSGMLDMAKNALCSLKQTGITKEKYVIVALDEVSYIFLKEFDANVLYFPSNFSTNAVNYREKQDFYKIVKVRPYIANKIIQMDADVLVCDIDIVFLHNPWVLASEDADIEVQVDSKNDYIIPYPKSPFYWSVNLGFYRIHSSIVMKRFLPIWIKKMTQMPDNHDQTVLWLLIRRLPISTLYSDTLLLNISSIISSNSNSIIRLRYFDPMLAVNAGGVFLNNKKKWLKEANKRKIISPSICHFFHISEIYQKIDLMKEKKLWYLNNDFSCKIKPPKGHYWPWWSK